MAEVEAETVPKQEEEQPNMGIEQDAELIKRGEEAREADEKRKAQGKLEIERDYATLRKAGE